MALNPVQAYTLTTSTTAQSIAIDTSPTGPLGSRTHQFYQAEIETKTADVVVKWVAPDSMAIADDTLTGNNYPPGNYHCLAGTVKVITIPRGATALSVKATGAGSIFVNVGFGERA